MAKPHQETDHRWSTWEELLLACAVNRHGTKSWDFVATEVQSRTASSLLLNAYNCRQKYHDLERRFVAVDPKSNGGDDASPSHEEKTVLWVEELRKLRVAELRYEVQRSDLSIVSLQQKVKKLKEEREQSLKEKENDEGKSDLDKYSKKIEGGGEKERDGESEKSSPVNDVDKRISGDESDRENRSFNESNSTGPKGKTGEIGAEPVRKPDEAAETAAGEPDPVSGKSVGGEDSYDGSSDTTAKAAAGEAAPIRVPDAGESAEFRESVAESKGEGAAKESSDVQSSASLSRKRRRTKAVPGGISGDEVDADEVSPAMKRFSVKSQRSNRLARFLEVIRSHKDVAVFERRSQESVDYRNVIRQHVDLEMVKTKLEGGLYSNSSLHFFRDLLLLFNNCIVFFPKNSTQSLAAIELRRLVSKEMMMTTRSISRPISNQKPNPPKRPNSTIQAVPKSNPNPSRPIVACRKRSSISVKPPLRLPAIEGKRNRPRPGPDTVKPGSDRDESEPDDNPTRNLSKRTRERSSLRMRGDGGNKSHKSSNTTPTNHRNSMAKAAKSLREDPTEAKTEEKKKKKKKKIENTNAKKDGVVNFLNRIKRSSGPSSPPTHTSKEAVNGRGRGRGEKRGGKGGEARRDQPVRRGSGGKQVQEKRNAERRSVGRPPKRAVPPPPPPPSKETRKTVESEGKPPHRKRARR